MPFKRCFNRVGLPRARWCDGCSWFGDPENGCWLDTRAEDEQARKHKCTGPKEAAAAPAPDAAAAAAEPELTPRSRAPPKRLKQSPARAEKEGYRVWAKSVVDVGELATSLRPKPSKTVSRSARLALKFAEFPEFPFIDGLENSLAGPVAQIAVAELLLQQKHVSPEHLLSSADPVLSESLAILRLKEADLRSFRSRIFDNKEVVERAIAKARRVQCVSESSDLATEAIWWRRRAEWEADRSSSIELRTKDYTTIRKTTLSRLKNALSKTRSQLKERGPRMVDLVELADTYRECRTSRGIGIARKYIMREIRAMVPGVGCERLSELCSMFYAMALIGLTDDSDETPPDAIETALIAETAAQQAPSATAWNSVPLYFHAHTLQRLSELLANIDVVFALSDEGHRGGQNHLVIQFAGWSSDLARPIVVTVDNDVVGKSGKLTAKAIFARAQELRVELRGQMTDSASPALLTQARELSQLLGGKWIAAGGCTVQLYTGLADDEAVARPLCDVLLAAIDASELSDDEFWARVDTKVDTYVGQQVDINGHSYDVHNYIHTITRHLDRAIVRQWPLDTCMDALHKWAQCDRSQEVEVNHFLNIWCRGYPSSTHSTERGVKWTGHVISNKPTQSAKVSRELHLAHDEIARSRHAILTETKSRERVRQLESDFDEESQSRKRFRPTKANNAARVADALRRCPTKESTEDAVHRDDTNEAEQLDSERATMQRAKERKVGMLKDRTSFATFVPSTCKDLVPKLPPEYTGMVTVGSIARIVDLEEELWLRGIMDNWAPPEGVDRRVHLRSLLPTIEVNGKQYLEGGRLGVVQAQATDAAAMAAVSSSAGEDEGVCTIM